MAIWSKAIQKIKNLKANRAALRHELVGPMHLWRLKRDFQISFLTNHGLEANHDFLDIGCGTLRGGIPIIDFLDERKYVGIDIRKKVLKEARKELIDHKLTWKEPTLLYFDQFEELNIDNSFDVIFAFSVLIHMTDEIVDKCLQFVSAVLKNDGVFYANVNLENVNDANWQNFPVVFRNYEFYESLANKHNLMLENIGLLRNLGHLTGDHLQDMQCMLKFNKKSYSKT